MQGSGIGCHCGKVDIGGDPRLSFASGIPRGLIHFCTWSKEPTGFQPPIKTQHLSAPDENGCYTVTINSMYSLNLRSYYMPPNIITNTWRCISLGNPENSADKHSTLTRFTQGVHKPTVQRMICLPLALPPKTSLFSVYVHILHRQKEQINQQVLSVAQRKCAVCD